MPKEIWKPATLLYPTAPVMVSCGSMEKPNIITVGWTGILNTRPAMCYISLRPERYSYNIIKESGDFVINLTTEKLLFAADFCGVRSGANTDKFAVQKLTPLKASIVNAPMIAESPLNLECKVKKIIELGSHHMFLAEIVAVQVESELVNRHGKLNLALAKLVAYCHGDYFSLGKQVGSFGYSVNKKGSRNGFRKK